MFCLLYCTLKVIDSDIAKHIIAEKKYTYFSIEVQNSPTRNKPSYIMHNEQFFSQEVDLDKDIVTCPVPYGGMLLLNNMIPHRR